MFYTKKNNIWYTANKMSFPNGEEVTEENKDEHIDLLNDYGWEWHDNPPQEYLDWLEEQENYEE